MSSTHFGCLLQCGKPCESADSIDNMTRGAWEKLKLKSLNWKGCDRFGNVYDSVDWELGPQGKHLHATCRLDISSSDKLKRSKVRQQKQDRESAFHEEACHHDLDFESPTPKRLRSSTGIVHNKSLCVWCMKPEDEKHPERTGRWVLLSYTSAWNVFRSHTVILQDDAMRDRINCLIDSITDPFSTEIRYHHKCWLKYIGQYQKMSAEEKLPLMHDVTYREAQTMFIDHVRQVVFVDHEIITLQGMLREYKNIMGTYGLPNLGVKSSYLKEMLVHKFGDGIGFHAPPRKNQSEIIYDTSDSSSYIEAVITLLGIDNNQLVQNVASMLREEIRKARILPWPPQVRELEQEEDASPLLVQLISSLRKPGQVTPDAKVLALASMLTYYATSNATTTSVNLGMHLHGLSRSKELVDVFHKVRVCISYASVLLLKDAWAVHELQLCSDCPNEIAENKPGVIIVDNDDFQNDTLTGGNTSHRTNVMYLQQVSIEIHGLQCDERVKDAKTLSSTLKELATGRQSHGQYITSKRGEPAVSNRIQACVGSTEPHRKRCAIHVLARADVTGERPATTNQKVPGFAGFQALISAPVEKSKAYYFMTYPEPPKKPVLNDVMMKIKKAIQRKSMPFAVVVGDQPVYTLLVEIKNEHPQEYEKVIPFLGPFHTQSCMIYAIYKRYKGSGIADVLVAAGVIAEGSVDQALRGKHYRRALRCLSLMYETLMHLILNKNLAGLELDAFTKTQLAVLREPMSTSQECLASALEKLENDPAIDSLICSMFQDLEVSDMANYWIDFMSMVEILMMNVYAIHTCNWEEYLISLWEMMPWLVAYDQTNYARWLPDFWQSFRH